VQEILYGETGADGRRKVIGVRSTSDRGESVLDAEVVIVAMGPWSSSLLGWPHPNRIGFSGRRAYSVIVSAPATPTALFTNINLEDKTLDVEIYPRPDGEFPFFSLFVFFFFFLSFLISKSSMIGTIYICGISDSTALPESVEEVQPSETAIQSLMEGASFLCPSVANADIVAKQACHLPGSPDGEPVIGPLPDAPGLYVCAGHSCWGILLSLASGLVISEMVQGHTPSIDVSGLLPGRLLNHK
jgi:glycine/D-amino acid oxidase-like deaminating enzyme